MIREIVRQLIEADDPQPQTKRDLNFNDNLVYVFMQGAVSIHWLPKSKKLAYTYVPKDLRVE